MYAKDKIKIEEGETCQLVSIYFSKGQWLRPGNRIRKLRSPEREGKNISISLSGHTFLHRYFFMLALSETRDSANYC